MEIADRLHHPAQRRTALDFGCGLGRLTQALAEHFEHVIGVDIAPSMIRQARDLNRVGERCEYVVNDAADLRILGERRFDLITSSIVLQHIHPKYSLDYIREFVRLLEPGGLLLFDLTAEQGGDATPLPSDAFRAEIVPSAPMLLMTAGAQSKVTVTVTNRSSVTWTSPVNLGNHWCDSEGSMIAHDDARASIAVPLAPGASVETTISVATPRVPGLYLLDLDVLQEGVAWFGQHGSPVTRIPVAVDPRADAVPEAPTIDGKPLVPAMQMYGVPLDVVVLTAQDAGARVLSIEACTAGGPGWLGYRYAFSRQ
jgi:SAM-dependent methyltransferase